MTYRNKSLDNKKKDLLDIIEEYLKASSASEARKILEQYPELLSTEADSMFDIAFEYLPEEAIQSLKSRRNFLAHCKRVGIAQAFEEISSSPNKKSYEKIQKILNEILSLSMPQDMPRKIVMLQHALSLVRFQSNPGLWAALHLELGIILPQNPQGNRDDYIEQAIDHCNKAIEVFTRDNFQVEWAKIHNTLATAYLDYFRGNRAENIEKAIEHCNKALEVRTKKDLPLEWAMTQHNLASAFYNRIRGDRAENIEKAIDHFSQALEIRTYYDFPLQWAETQNNLATAYCDRVRGNKAENIEKAIEYCNQALKVFRQDIFPLQWAGTQHNLANAYRDRIRGKRMENIENAIEHYNKALEVCTFQAFPNDWAKIQNNLATAYKNRIRGEKTDNIKQAIKNYENVLTVYTDKDFPMQWAITQNNLALAYWNYISGDWGENIDKAIEYYNQTLRVFTRKDFPMQWAMILNNLAAAYLSRIRGDHAENIEQAIECHRRAMEVRTKKDFPVDWAMTQNNLATAYINRIRGKKAENIELAIKHFIQALEIRTKEDLPVEWAETQNNLANTYKDRISGDRAENIEKAIEHCNQALEVRTKKDLPVDWAMTQNNLASAYFYRVTGHKAYNLELAIEHFNNALEVYKEDSSPSHWAGIQNNLATTYYNRIRGNKAKNIEKAINHCYCVLKICKLESMPNDFLNTHKLLGDIYFDIGQWKNSVESYKESIKAGNLLYRSGLSAESKTLEVEKNVHIYRNATFATCRIDSAAESLLIFEGGKTRLLNEALKLKTKQPEGVPIEEWMKYEQAAEKYRAATNSSGLEEDYFRKEKEVQKALDELNASVNVVQSYNPEFQKELDISNILLTPDNETALLTFCITNKGSIGFLISQSGNIKSYDLHNFKTEDLDNLFFKPGEKYITGGWIGDYLNYLDAVDTKSRIDAFHTWDETLNHVLSSVGSRLLSPLLADIPPHIKKIILLPSGGLYMLPLHAVPLPDGQLLCQRYCVSYAPSISLLRKMQNDALKTEGEGLFTVINPEEDPSLVFSGCEGQSISKLFKSHQMNTGRTITKAKVLERVRGRAYLHFSCHGCYNWNDPPQSGLYLDGEQTLSLTDLRSDEVNMSSARLVTLSACETGITDILKSRADEFVGLPAGFMLAGVPCVVSSLWSVPDISTALLMERFYSNHIKRQIDIPQALQDAQLWVRDLTSSQVADYVEKCYCSGKWEGKSKEFIERYREHFRKMAKEFPDEKPFLHPYYWAAFTVNGA